MSEPWIDVGAADDLPEFELARLREREALCAASAALRKGLAAFAARRAPRFEGR